MEDEIRELVNKIKGYLPEEWKNLEYDEQLVKNAISDLARELPIDVYETIRDAILDKLFSMNEGTEPFLSYVVDTNVIVSDSFRVASGRTSTTERIFSSIFVKLYAPMCIEKEVYEEISKDLPKNCSLELAMDQAKKLLSKIDLVDDSVFETEFEEMKKFEEVYGNDASFLRVSLGLGVKSMITWDKDFERTGAVKTLHLGAAVKLIVSVEAGALSISIVGGAAYIGAKSIYWLLYLLYRALIEIFGFMGYLTTVGITGMGNLVSKAPDWAWYLLLAGAIGGGLALVFSKDLRKKLSDNATKLYNWVSIGAKVVIDTLADYIRGLVDLTNVLKEDLGPYFVYTVVGLLLTIGEMTENLASEE